jgi:hypothetical protein
VVFFAKAVGTPGLHNILHYAMDTYLLDFVVWGLVNVTAY